MNRRQFALALSTLTLVACHTPESTPEGTERAPERTAERTAESAPSTPLPPAYTLVFLKTGPKSGQLAQEENAQAFAGHFANMGRLAEARQLLVAGPFGKERHDPALRGLFVLASAQRDEARAWAETDPTTQAGVFVLEYHDLATEAPLAAALERALAREAQREAEGKTPDPAAGARPYVLLTAEHGDLAERELSGLCTREGGVLFLARLDGTRAFALLDANDLAEARERFGPQLESLGAHVLDEWFASAELAGLVQ